MKKHIILLIGILTIAIVLLASCSTAQKTSDSAPEVNLIETTEEVASIDAYIEEISAIHIDTDSIIIVPPTKLLLWGKMIITFSPSKVAAFGTDGRYAGSFGRMGNGPGEFLRLQDCCVDQNRGELLCLTHRNEVLRYSLSDFSYLDKIAVEAKGITATAIMPLDEGGFALFFPNPPQSGLSDFDDDFYCLRAFNSEGKELEESLLRDDFNVNMGFSSPSIQCKDSYALSYRIGNGLCYSVRKGEITPLLNLSFGNRSIPYRESFNGVNNPWEKIGEIFESDYFKCQSSVCYTDDVYYVSAFGKNSAVWNFVIGKSLKRRGIRWQSVGKENPPMRALASDGEYLYFCYGETGIQSSTDTSDPLQKVTIDRLGLVLGENDNPVIVKVKFKI
jgi:hypothetical protein